MSLFNKVKTFVSENFQYFIIVAFVIISHFQNFAFFSKHQTFIFGDTAIYTLYLAGFYEHLNKLLTLKDNFLFWNPNYLSSGISTLSIVDMAYLYPVNIAILLITRLFNNVLLLFPFYMFSIYLHLTVGAFFVYKILSKYFKLDRFQSLFGALIWTFVGFNTEWFSAGQVLITASYLPICFYFSLKMMKESSFKNYAIYYISTALSFLAGYTMVAVIIYGVCTFYRVLMLRKIDDLGLTRLVKSEIKGLFFIVFPIILPVYINPMVIFSLSIRSILNIDSFLVYSTHVVDLFESIFPRNTLFNTESKNNIVYLYLSLVGLIVLFESQNIKSVLKVKRNLIIGLIGVLALLVSLGKATPLAGWLFYLLPGFNYFRRINIFSLLVGFSFCLLIPQFINDRFYKTAGNRLKVFLIILFYVAYIRTSLDKGNFEFKSLVGSFFISFTVISATYLSFHLVNNGTKNLRYILILVLLLESVLNNSSKFYNNSKINPAAIFKPNKLVKTLQSEIKPMDRVDLLATSYNYTTDYLDLEQTAGYISLASVYGVRINEVINRPGVNPATLLDLIGVRYLVQKGDENVPGIEKIQSFYQDPKHPDFYKFDYRTYAWRPETGNAAYSIYKRPSAFSRIFLATSVLSAIQDESVLNKIIANADSQSIFLDVKDVRDNQVSGSGNLQILEYKRNYIKAKVDITNTGYLANSTAYYPGWFIRVNGKWRLPTQTNWFMMGTYLTKGLSTVEFIYVPFGMIIGTTYGLVILTFFLRRKSKIISNWNSEVSYGDIDETVLLRKK